MYKTPLVRTLLMGLLTLFGIKRQGYFIPYRYANKIGLPGTLPTYQLILEMFQTKNKTQISFLNDIEKYSNNLKKIGSLPQPEPRWNQNWLQRIDGAAAYTMVREKAPNLIIEVGSGHSTRFMAKAINDGNLKTQIITIDPAPRAEIAQLDITIIKDTVENVGTAPFEKLSGKDFLFVDSSHIMMPGTDVDFLFNRILPGLPSGIILHIHDIFLPDDYPPHWAWRGYNEQQGVATLLQNNGFDILFSSNYVTNYLAEKLENSVLNKIKLTDDAIESSLWLRKI